MLKNYLILILSVGFLNQSLAQVNLNFGLIAQYNFTDQSLDDAGQYFLNLINNNGAIPTADRFGIPDNAYQFDGIDDYLSTSNDPVLTLGYGATISLWVKLNDVIANQKLIGKLTTPPITFDGGYLVGVENGQFKIETWVVGSVPYSLTAGSISANQWTHVAVTFQSTNYVTLHVNGQAIDSVLVSDALEANGNDLIIGAAPWDQAYFLTDGAIDDIRLYNRKINSAELNAIYTEVVTNQKEILTDDYSYYYNNGFYTINASNNQKISAIVVRDAGGRIVKTQNSNQSQSENIAISDLSKGVYFASVYSNAGVKTLKLLN
jgi:hypothetical protein